MAIATTNKKEVVSTKIDGFEQRPLLPYAIDELEAIVNELNLNIKVTKMAEAKEYRKSLSLRAVQSGTSQKAEKEIKEDAKFPETLI